MLANERVQNVTVFYKHWLFAFQSVPGLDWQNTKLSCSGRKRADPLLQICVCSGSVPFHGSAACLSPVLSLAVLHPAFSMPPTVWIPRQEISAWKHLTCFDIFMMTAKSLRAKAVASPWVHTVRVLCICFASNCSKPDLSERCCSSYHRIL